MFWSNAKNSDMTTRACESVSVLGLLPAIRTELGKRRIMSGLPTTAEGGFRIILIFVSCFERKALGCLIRLHLRGWRKGPLAAFPALIKITLLMGPGSALSGPLEVRWGCRVAV